MVLSYQSSTSCVTTVSHLILSHTYILVSGEHIFGFSNSCLPEGILISIQFLGVNMNHHFILHNIYFNIADAKDNIFN